MKKTYTIRENNVIIFPNTKDERNLTEECKECSYCIYNKQACRGNKEGIFCDWFTIDNDYNEIDE